MTVLKPFNIPSRITIGEDNEDNDDLISDTSEFDSIPSEKSAIIVRTKPRKTKVVKPIPRLPAPRSRAVTMSTYINNNPMIEDKLNVIAVISNPMFYMRRYQLFFEFMTRMNKNPNVNFFVVELCYGYQKHFITNEHDPNHLQLSVEHPLWHKENMINIAVEKLLPKDYKAFAWIDADITFESPSWAIDTLKVLNDFDIVQLFSHCEDLDKDELSMNIFTSFCYNYCKSKPYINNGLNYWHSGYAWAITRKAYEQIGGLYQYGILGSGDAIIALSLIGRVDKIIRSDYSEGYKHSMYEFQRKVSNLKIGYVPCVIRHSYHGSKKNRKYMERGEILVKYNYDPYTMINTNNMGLFVPNRRFKREFLKDILKYFDERKEDE